MRLQKVQDALEQKKIKYEYNIYAAGRSQDIEGDYEGEISKEILSWPDMVG